MVIKDFPFSLYFLYSANDVSFCMDIARNLVHWGQLNNDLNISDHNFNSWDISIKFMGQGFNNACNLEDFLIKQEQLPLPNASSILVHLSSEIVCIFLVLGKANGKGLYTYEKGSKPKPDPSVLPIIEECRRLSNIMPGGKVVISDTKIDMLVASNSADCSI